MPVFTSKTTRRVLLGGIALTVPAALVGRAIVSDQVPSLSDRLIADLAQMTLPTADATLNLVGFETLQGAGAVTLAARIRMDWAPGQRQRGFRVAEIDTEASYAALITQISAAFAQA